MPRVEKTIFISYRRTNLPWALAIYQNLTFHGYDAFFDYNSIDSGNFEKVILENIKIRAHFLVILTPSALERLKEPNDWLRREIETAMDEKRNIIPLMLESFDFGSPLATQALTGKLAALNTYNGLKVYSEYFFEAMDKLRDRYLNVTLDRVYLPELNAETKGITEAQTSAASEAPQVEKEELTAQEWFERGYVFQQDKKIDEAIRCYEESIRIQPDVSVTHNNLGVLLKSLNRYAEAEEAYRQAIAKGPNYAAAYSNLGALLSDKKLERYAEAEEAFRQAIAKDPNDAAAYSNLGTLLHEKLERYVEAEEAYRHAIAKDPDFALAYSNLGNLLSDKEPKRYVEAEEAYRQAIAKDPNYAAAYSNLGILLKKLERYAEAEEAFRQAIAKDPNYAAAYSNLGSLLHEKLERYAEAEEAYRKAIAKDLDFAVAYSNLGLLLHDKLERYAEAEASYRQAIAKDPNYAAAYSNLGILLKKLERYAEAEEAFRQAIAKDPNYAAAYSNLGLLLHDKLERYAEAEASYRQAIAKDPNYADSYINLALLLRGTNQERAALPILEKLIEIDPEGFNSYLGIASIKKTLGEPIEPSFIEKARQYIPEDDFYDRACLESVFGNFDLAFEHLQHARQKEEFDLAWAWEDPDLQWIRDDPRFVEIVGPKPEK